MIDICFISPQFTPDNKVNKLSVKEVLINGESRDSNIKFNSL